MAITNASMLAEFGSGIGTIGAVLQVDNDNKRVGIGTTNPQAMLQVGTGVTVFGNVGIASFTSLKLSGETDSTSTTTGALTVTGGVGIGLSLTVGGDVSVGGTITYEDVTNVDSIGIVTARSGLRVVGGGVTCVGVATFFNDIQVGDKIIHNGDTNTAIRFADADTITAETGGSERVRIASDGDVIIGGSSDAGYTNYADNLTIHGTGNEGITIRSGTTSQGAIYFSDATGSGTGTYEGNIIYDHNINALLFGSNHVERFRIGSGGIIEIRSNMQTIGDQNIIRFTDTDTSVSAGQTIGRLQWYSSDASGGGACVKAEIEAVCYDTTPDAWLAFKTHDGSGTTPDEQMRIDSTGRVLIGTTTEGESTADDLTIANSGSGGITIRSGTSGEGNIFFSDGTSGTAEYEGTIQYSHASNYMQFFTNHAERLRITSAGLVGISSINPTRQIEMYDASHATAALCSGTQSSLFFSKPTDTNIGQISYMHSSDYMYFRVNDAEALRIEDDGQVNFKCSDMSNPDIGGGIAGVAVNKGGNTGQIYACTDAGSDNYTSVVLNLSRRNSSYDGPQIVLDRGGWAKASIAGLQGSNTASSAAGHFAIYTHNAGAGTRSERLRITGDNGHVGIGTIDPYALLTVMGTAEGGGANMADHGIMLHAPGAVNEDIIPITACYETSGTRPRSGIGFISKPTVDPIESYAGEIGFYTRDAADGSGLAEGDEKMRINKVGRVGIGQTIPNTLLNVAGNGTAVLRLENTSTGLGSDDLIGAVEFEKQDASGAGVGIAGGMRCRSNDSYGARSYLAFSVRSNSTGAAAVDTEVIRMTTSGICFNGDITDGALNDYEEGSWTPAPSTGTVTVNNARYVRVGRKVTVWANISQISENSSGAQFYLTGLPFTTDISQAAGSMMGYDINSMTYTTYINHTEKIYFYGINAGTSWETNSYNDFTANSQFYFCGTYEAT